MAKKVENEIRKAVYLRPEIASWLDKQAEEKCTNVSNLIRMIIKEKYDEQNKH